RAAIVSCSGGAAAGGAVFGPRCDESPVSATPFPRAVVGGRANLDNGSLAGQVEMKRAPVESGGIGRRAPGARSACPRAVARVSGRHRVTIAQGANMNRFDLEARPSPSRSRLRSLVVLLVTLRAGVALAEPPSIDRLVPQAVRPGEATEIVVRGKRLDGPVAL